MVNSWCTVRKTLSYIVVVVVVVVVFCRQWWWYWSPAAQWNAPNATRYLIPSYTNSWRSFKHNTARAWSKWTTQTCAAIKGCLSQECHFSIWCSTCTSRNTQRRIYLGRWRRTWGNAVVNLCKCQRPTAKWEKIHQYAWRLCCNIPVICVQCAT